MLDIIRELSLLNGTSGREKAIRDYIISKTEGRCEYRIDPLGNLIAFKKGRQTPKNKIMLDAHMDEVGIIATYINSDGTIKFSTVGSIEVTAMLGRQFMFENGTVGVVGVKPVHLLSADEKSKIPSADSLCIDIGASSKEDAQKKVRIGETAVFVSDFVEFGKDRIKGKAFDDRVGCAILIDLINSELEYDCWFSFSVQEEIGLRGAATSAYSIAPDYAIVLETTTAADLIDVPDHKKVCILGNGATVSFMDRTTLYSKELFDKAFETAGRKGIKIQPKTVIAGGNNAGSILKSGCGIKTITVNTPCRYLHSPSCVCDINDINSARALAQALIEEFANA